MPQTSWDQMLQAIAGGQASAGLPEGEGYTPATTTPQTGVTPGGALYDYEAQTAEQFDLGEYASGQGFSPYTPTGQQMPGGSASQWADFVQEQYGMSAQDFIGGSQEEQYAAYAQTHDIALTPEDVPVGPDGLPSRPPKTPQEAALFQFVSEQRTRQQNEELLQQAIQQMEAGLGAQQAEAGRAREAGVGLLREGIEAQAGEAQRARTEATGAIRAGQERQEQEVAEVRAQNRQLMEQSLSTMQYSLGLLRRGGEGSLAQFAQPGYGQMAPTYMQGRETPFDFGQPYQALAGIYGQQQNLMGAYGAMADIEGRPEDYGRFYAGMADIYNQSQYEAQDFSFYLTPYAYGVGIGGA